MRRRHVSSAAGFALAAALATLFSTAGVEGQSWRTVTQSRQVSNERSLDVNVSYAVGQFRVRPAASGVLYRLELRYDEDTFEPVNDYRKGRLRVGIDGGDGKIRVGKGDSAGNLDLDLAVDVPMDLNLEFGAVKADLDLGGLALTDLHMVTGASETFLDVSRPNPVSLGTAKIAVGAAQFHARSLGNLNAERIDVDAGVGDITLDFTGDWQRDAEVNVDLGVGALELRVPEGLGLRLKKDSFLTTLDPQGLVKRGDYYYSTDWDEADRQVDIDVDAALAKVSVVWVR